MMRLLPLAAVLALVAAGCGGGGGTRLTKTQLDSQGDAICRVYNAKLKALGTPTTMQDLKSFADKALPIAQEGRKKLGELKPPQDLEGTYNKWLAEGDKAVDAIKRLSDAAKKGDAATVRKIGQEAARESATSHKLAKQLGFTTCAQG